MIVYLVLLTYIIINVIFYISLRHEYRYRDGKCLLVSFPEIEKDNEKVINIIKKYEKQSKWLFLTILCLQFSCFLIPKFIVLPILLFLFAITIQNLPLHFAHQALKNIKKENVWFSNTRSIRKIDISISNHVLDSMLHPCWFAIPLILMIGITVIVRPVMYVYYFLALWVLIPILFYIIIKQLPNRTYCDDTTTNILLNRLRQRWFSIFLLLVSFGDTCFYYMVILVSSDIYSLILLVLSCCFATVFMMAAGIALFHYQMVRRRIMKSIENPILYYDEDDFWHYGIFGAIYSNPDDLEVFKENGSSMNTSLNMARPSVKLFLGVVIMGVASLLICLFGYPLLLDYQHKLVDVECNNDMVRIDGALYKKEIPIDTISKVSFLSELPKAERVWGMDTGVYATGNFRNKTLGTFKMYVAYRHQAFIKIETKTGIIIFNDDDTMQTKRVYEQIELLLKGVDKR